MLNKVTDIMITIRDPSHLMCNIQTFHNIRSELSKYDSAHYGSYITANSKRVDMQNSFHCKMTVENINLKNAASHHPAALHNSFLQ